MRRLVLLVAAGALLASTWIALTRGQIAPLHLNILYFHVPSAICSLLCFVVLLVASLGTLISGRSRWDHWALAAAEVACVLVTILNVTGMIFSRSEWQVWWTPSPRLVTSALLWFLVVVYLILRVGLHGTPRRVARICAVFGIIAFLDVPMVYISARYLPDIHRPNFSFDASWPRAAFGLAMAGTCLLAGVLMSLRADLLASQERLQASFDEEGVQ